MSERTNTVAEKAADTAPRTRSTLLQGAQGLRLQRKCACGGGSCQSCGEKKRLLRAARAGAEATSSEAPPLVHEVLATPGEPLSSSARAFMEPRFKHDFGKVRVHADERAAASARAVDALAYTVGQHIVFGQGQYQPSTPRGQHLLAHELAHTVQQGEASGTSIQALTFDSPGHGALEQEAESVAVAVLQGLGTSATPRPAIPHRPIGARLSRARTWDDKNIPTPLTAQPITTSGGSHEVTGVDNSASGLSPGSANASPIAFRIDKFYLHAAKHHFQGNYKKRAHKGGLETVVGLSGKNNPEIHLKQVRDDLQESWLRTVGWPTRSDTLWQSAAQKAFGAPPPSNLECFKAPNGQKCQIDHIIELQLQGTNVQENLTPLEAQNNGKSGISIYHQLAQLHRELRKRLPSLPEELTFNFSEIDLTGDAPNPDDECLRIAKEAPNVAPAGTTPPGNTAGAYTVKAGLTSATFDPAPKGARIEDLASSSATNNNARQLISGLLLKTLDRKQTRQRSDFFVAVFDFRESGKQKTRIPSSIDLDSSPKELQIDVTSNRTLQLHDPKAAPRVAFTYPFLSEGWLDLAYNGTKGLSGKGKLIPSLSLLKNAPINVAADFQKDEFTGSIDVPAEKLSLPSGFHITESKLGLDLAPTFRPHGSFAFEAGPRKNPLLKALLKADRDEKGFVASGQVDAFLPFVDSTKGSVEYRDHQWSGSIDIQTRQIPFVKDASLHVGFDEQGAHPSGQVQLELPGGQQVDLNVRQDEKTKEWIYQGKGLLQLPNLEPVELNLTYGAQGLTGKAKTHVKLRGMTGSLTVGYEQGKLFGAGTLSFKRDRASGHVEASLNSAQKLTGKGNLTYQITENLLGTAGVEFDGDQGLEITGGLRFDKPLTLFNHLAKDYTLFEKSLEFPILGVSLGFTSVGIIAVLTGSLSAGYAIGPGKLSHIQLHTKFNPLAANPNLALSLGAELDVPLSAHLTLGIRGGVGLSAGIGSVTGGLTVTGSAVLNGGLHSKATLGYQNKVFSLDTTASLLQALELRLGLSADILAKALGYSKQWRWNLASYQWSPGVQFGLVAPLHYDSAKGIALGRIQWVYPQPNVRNLVLDIVKRVTG